MMAIEYSVENVSVVDFQVTGWLNSQGLGDERFVSHNRQLPFRNHDQNRTIAEDLRPPGDQARGTALQDQTGGNLGKLAIGGQTGEIHRTQHITLSAEKGCYDEIRKEEKYPVASLPRFPPV